MARFGRSFPQSTRVTKSTRRLLPTYVQEVLIDLPGLYWRVDELSGTTARDYTGSGNDGTYTGLATLNQTGALLSDDNPGISTSDPAQNSGGAVTSTYIPWGSGGAWTVECWCDANSLGGVLWRGNIHDTHSGVDGSNGLVSLNLGGTTVTWTAAAPTSGYFHYALTHDEATDTAELFINGVSKGTRTNAGTPSGAIRISATSQGGPGWGGPGNAKVDEFAVYKSALTSTRILEHYKASGWFGKIRVGQVIETNIATALTRLKRKAVNQITETDTATAMTRRKLSIIGQTIETDSATAMARLKRRTLIQTTETDLGRTITAAAKVNRVIEMDIASAFTPRKVRILVQTLETDTAQPMTRRKLRAVNQIVETNIAQTMTRRKLRAINQITEIDVAQPMGRLKLRFINQVSEADIARTIAWLPKNRLVSRVIESDIAQGMIRLKTRSVNRATEIDIAQTFTTRHLRTLSQISETDIAQAMTKRKVKLLGQTVEVDTAQVINWAPKKRFVVQVIEIDLARNIFVSGRVAQAIETDLAQALTHRKFKLINQISETDIAQTMIRRHARLVGQVIEVDAAQAFTHLKRKTLVQPGETDIAQPFAHLKRMTIGQGIEIDTAQRIGKVVFVGVGRAIEVDTPQIITPFQGTLVKNKITMIV